MLPILPGIQLLSAAHTRDSSGAGAPPTGGPRPPRSKAVFSPWTTVTLPCGFSLLGAPTLPKARLAPPYQNTPSPGPQPTYPAPAVHVLRTPNVSPTMPGTHTRSWERRIKDSAVLTGQVLILHPLQRPTNAHTGTNPRRDRCSSLRQKLPECGLSASGPQKDHQDQAVGCTRCCEHLRPGKPTPSSGTPDKPLSPPGHQVPPLSTATCVVQVSRDNTLGPLGSMAGTG